MFQEKHRSGSEAVGLCYLGRTFLYEVIAILPCSDTGLWDEYD
jgi:hypothetical protein